MRSPGGPSCAPAALSLIPFDEGDWNLGFKETHTFQNIMENPMGTITFMSLYNTTGDQTYFNGEEGHTPTFDFRGFCWMISPHNPNLTQYENCYTYFKQLFLPYIMIVII